MLDFLKRRMMTVQTVLVGAVAWAESNNIDVLEQIGGFVTDETLQGPVGAAILVGLSVGGGLYQNHLNGKT